MPPSWKHASAWLAPFAALTSSLAVYQEPQGVRAALVALGKRSSRRRYLGLSGTMARSP